LTGPRVSGHAKGDEVQSESFGRETEATQQHASVAPDQAVRISVLCSSHTRFGDKEKQNGLIGWHDGVHGSTKLLYVEG
jgi:hypothetical protein